MRVALVLEYDGTRYYGSQMQKNAPTIQEELEKAITKVTGERVRAKFAGRTDQGVHAKGQVAVFDTYASMAPTTITKALNYYLPSDIAIKESNEVSKDFDPRRSALSREYSYYIWNEPTRSPLRRHTSLLIRQPLEVDAMNEACKALEGTHDFAPFAGALEDLKNTIRTMYKVDTYKEGSLVTCYFKANAFLPHQIRHTVGSLIKVGLKLTDVSAFCRIFDSRKAATAGPSVPPYGLCLLKVNYAGDAV